MDCKRTGKLIAEKRKEKGFNQIQLAQLLNVSNRTVSKWENGDGFPDISMLPQISDVLDITIDELLTGQKPEPIIIDDGNNKKSEKDNRKLLNDFKLCYAFAFFSAIFSALLGGVTELYCIWAFPILFYTHWEIIFAAVSLFFAAISPMIFTAGVIRLHLHYSKTEIINMAKNKITLLAALLVVFPLTFIARIIDVSRMGVFMPVFMVFIIAAIVAAFVYMYKRLKKF